jgi:hypothetical protein
MDMPTFTTAQTNGQERRDTRQNCRQANGAVGAAVPRLILASRLFAVALVRVAYQRHQGVALCRPLGVRGSLLPVPLGDEAVKPLASP